MNTANNNIQGYCDPAFIDVQNTFLENFTKRGEIGAGVCVYKNSKKSKTKKTNKSTKSKKKAKK